MEREDPHEQQNNRAVDQAILLSNVFQNHLSISSKPPLTDKTQTTIKTTCVTK